ncbi:Uncharacterized conserved protein YybS, DUF2232 family [Tissierella praeacuta DSM 18095]|uniref:Uncharacterized conserved protein YybS, DUF2232 family n=1 Tax=Tissierella praeacuta DSM 18095 TaxID=1123404 RepID=A0A1M4Y3W0_9FIRM|nr:DUF2232 domain-containing protein [Tissierella praeacuta]TCU79494.1 uncharacterized protein YybS (DUF2232 family) [Tissierella praeacuta]SHF00286.1 Uncharacterized conserved protein YybS, DUF2232 family [Tissierella praeacuta DSM 18095]SUO98875.1 Predicted membrane protein [Tissierella praeacuta]
MKNNDKIKKSTIESIIVISIMTLYIVYGIHVVPLLMLFIPVPFAILGIRNGIYINVISIIATSIIIGVLLGFISGVSIILIFAPLSLALNYCISKRKDSMETIFITTIAFFISFLVLIGLEANISNLNLTKQLESNFTQLLTMQIDMLNEVGMSKYEVLRTTDLLENAYKTIIILIPSLISIFSLAVSYINLLFSSIILRKMGYGIANYKKFSKFKLPNNIIPGIGIMLFTAFIIKTLKIQYHEALLINITFLISFVFFLQGLAVLDFLLIKSKLHVVFRILIISLNIVFIPMSSILFFIGIFDSIFDIRKIRRRKSL